MEFFFGTVLPDAKVKSPLAVQPLIAPPGPKLAVDAFEFGVGKHLVPENARQNNVDANV